MSKKKKIPLALRVIRFTIWLLELIASPIAGRLAVKLFFSPIRFPISSREKDLLSTANNFSLALNGEQLAGYYWGDGDRSVLLMHGWSGKAVQLFHFVEPLVKKGYKVVAFDAPAHGNSPGKKTNIIEFADGIELMAKKFGNLDAIVAHSLGGAAASYALQRELLAKKLVMISSPVLADQIIDEFLELINASKKLGKYLTDHVLNKYHQPFENFTVLKNLDGMRKIPVLAIHDRVDAQVDFKHATAMRQHFPEATYHETEGLGHVRILSNKEIISMVVDFVDTNQQKSG